MFVGNLVVFTYRAATAIFPVMPRGVEHSDSSFRSGCDLFCIFAIFPVMPRGVEHSVKRPCRRMIVNRRAIFPCDAARR